MLVDKSNFASIIAPEINHNTYPTKVEKPLSELNNPVESSYHTIVVVCVSISNFNTSDELEVL